MTEKSLIWLGTENLLSYCTVAELAKAGYGEYAVLFEEKH
jgi:hypothetical protein